MFNQRFNARNCNFKSQFVSILGELYGEGCENTVQACMEACETTPGCCGFNFVFNPGSLPDLAKMGRCVAKACDGRIGTSRYGNLSKIIITHDF